jgi:plasmid maintenance system antidote protein VapI
MPTATQDVKVGRPFRPPRNLSPSQIAEAMCVDRTTVHRWISGARRVPPMAIRLAELLWGPGQAEWPLDRTDLSGE